MTASRIVLCGMLTGMSFGLPGAGGHPALAQDDAGLPRPKVLRQAAVGESIQSINDDYNRQLLQLERRRLERLVQLAERQEPTAAAETYETLFRLAVANNLFIEAEPAADRILKSTSRLSPVVHFLAQTTNIIAAADRGAYDESLADLRKLIGDRPDRNRAAEHAPALLDTPSLMAICGAYYQRLIQGDRFDVARNAFQLIGAETSNPAIKEYCSGRLYRLNMLGKPAPPIQGPDVDGKPVSLADLKGNVVLVVFWASWCLPCADEIMWLDQTYDTYRDRGFRILGIDLDTSQAGDLRLETVMPNIRHFLLDHNVRWPNLVNEAATRDYAKAYGITDIPTNVLIGPDGTVIHLDLTRKNLDQVVARAMTRR
jgi:peroxiredoxin